MNLKLADQIRDHVQRRYADTARQRGVESFTVVAGEVHSDMKALEEFVRRRQNQELLDQLNAAYDDAPDASSGRCKTGWSDCSAGC